jgi:hypothetical protein
MVMLAVMLAVILTVRVSAKSCADIALIITFDGAGTQKRTSEGSLGRLG